jgi:hypothetical protein
MITRVLRRLTHFDARLVLAAGLLVSAAAVACDRAALLAPTQSTITLNASTRIVPLGGTSELQATVLENSGSPVPNGTTVRFTTSLGRIEPAEAQTRNGVATAMFVAGTESGTAQVRAISGLANGGTTTPGTGGTGTPTTTTTVANVVEIAVGAAAASSITLSANPSTVRASGSSVDVLAFVTASNGNPLGNVPVAFSATRGTITPVVANTDANGVAHTTLTASETTTVTATVGGGTAPGTGTPTTPAPTGTRTATLEIRAATVASFTLAVAPTTPAANQPVSLTITPAANTAPRVIVNWGDGTEQDIGAVSAARVVVHTYTNPGFYTITANGTSPEGDTFSNSIPVTVGQQPPVELTVTPTTGQIGTVFTFTVTPTTGAIISNVTIDFGDGTRQEFGPINTQRTVTHSYSTIGTKTITAEQTEANGGRVTRASVIVSVTN